MPWPMICVCELWSSNLEWMDSFIMSHFLQRNDIQTISKPSLLGGLTITHKKVKTNPAGGDVGSTWEYIGPIATEDLRHRPISSMRSASSKTRQDTWGRFVHGMPLKRLETCACWNDPFMKLSCIPCMKLEI